MSINDSKESWVEKRNILVLCVSQILQIEEMLKNFRNFFFLKLQTFAFVNIPYTF